MKKLMIAATVAMAAAFANAAAMTWGEGDYIYQPTSPDGAFSDSKKVGSNATVYLFELNATKYAELYAADYATAAANVFKEFASVDSKGKITVADYQQTDSTSFSKFDFTDSRTFVTDGADTVARAALIITYTDASGNDWYIANIASYTFEKDLDDGNSSMANWQFGNSAGTAVSGWTAAAVPEPTSGLLLLLGVAGLALRRRRA